MLIHFILTTVLHWRRKWQPTPVILPVEFHGQGSLAGYSPWGHKESDLTESLTHTHSLIFLFYVLCKGIDFSFITEKIDELIFYATNVQEVVEVINTFVSLRYILKTLGTSLVVQWLRVCLQRQGTGVQSLVREDPTCLGSTACVPQLLNPSGLKPLFCNKRSHNNEKPTHSNEE